jgi:hypothetical protein
MSAARIVVGRSQFVRFANEVYGAAVCDALPVMNGHSLNVF